MYVTIVLVLSISYITTADLCYNNYPCCAGWAAKGLCKNGTFVKTNCQAACGLCKPSYSADNRGECTDYFRWYCKNGVARGVCQEKENWMEENCRKACGKCGNPPQAGCPDSPPVDGCDVNEEFVRACGGCEKFCSDTGLSTFCWDSMEVFARKPCKYQCRCKQGYIEDRTRSTGKKCILPKDCVPLSTTTESTTTTTSKPVKECGENAEPMQFCGSCDWICRSHGQSRICWDAHEAFTEEPCPINCLCKRGYIKDWSNRERYLNNSACILPEQCVGERSTTNNPKAN